MDEYFCLHGTNPHAEPMDFIFRYQFYWFDNNSSVGLSYLLFTYQFYFLIGLPGSCHVRKIILSIEP